MKASHLGFTRMDLPFLLGTAFSVDRPKARVIGYLVHFVTGCAFALGYYAGLRISDVSHLLVRNTHVGPKIGWILAGYKRETYRELDLLNEARRPLYEYLASERRGGDSAYVFTSQRAKKAVPQGDEDGWRLTEDGSPYLSND